MAYVPGVFQAGAAQGRWPVGGGAVGATARSVVVGRDGRVGEGDEPERGELAAAAHGGVLVPPLDYGQGMTALHPDARPDGWSEPQITYIDPRDVRIEFLSEPDMNQLHFVLLKDGNGELLAQLYVPDETDDVILLTRAGPDALADAAR